MKYSPYIRATKAQAYLQNVCTTPESSLRKCFQHLCRYIYPIMSVYDIYAKISVYEIEICTLNAPLIFHQRIMFMNESWGQLLTTIIQILVIKTGDSSCKICYFYKCVHYVSAKIVLVSSATILVGEWLQRQWQFWIWPLYIPSKCDVTFITHLLL